MTSSLLAFSSKNFLYSSSDVEVSTLFTFLSVLIVSDNWPKISSEVFGLM